MNGISKLDLLKTGRRGLTQRLASLESHARTATVGLTGGGQQVVTGGGSIVVANDGFVQVSGSGFIRAGLPFLGRTEMTEDGFATYNDANELQLFIQSTDGAMRVLGQGSISVEGGGSVWVSGGGGLLITDDGAISVEGTGGITLAGGGSLLVQDTGSIKVTGSGVIRAGSDSAQRVDMRAAGLSTYAPSGVEMVRLDAADGKLKVLQGSGIVVTAANGVQVQDGEIVVTGTGRVRAGPVSDYHAELYAGGLALYNSGAQQTLLLSSITGKLHILSDSIDIAEEGKLSVVSGLVWADSKGLWAIDTIGDAAFAVSGRDNQAWGGATLDRGDVLIGKGTNAVRWDASEGTLIVSGNGAGLTSINGGNITTGTVTASALSATAIDGKVITGATLRTSAATNVNRVVIDSAGIFTYNASNQEQVRLATADGGALVFANGAVKLNRNGFAITARTLTFDPAGNTAVPQNIVWTSNGNVIGTIETSVVENGLLTPASAMVLAATPLPGFGTTADIWLKNDTTVTGALEVNVDVGITGLGWLKADFINQPLKTTSTVNFWDVRAGGGFYPGGQTSFGLQYVANYAGFGGISSNGNIITGAAILAGNWFRSVGNTGWYSQTHGGGLWMTDFTYLRTYGSKVFSVEHSTALGSNGGDRVELQRAFGNSGQAEDVGLSTALYRMYGVNTTAASAGILLQRFAGAGYTGAYIMFGVDNIGVRTANPQWRFHLGEDSAAKPNGGSWTNSSSDARTKRVLGDYRYGLSALRALRLVDYEYNGRGGTVAGLRGSGFVAQEAKLVIPEMVSSRWAQLDPEDGDETELLTLNNDPAIYATMKAVQELADIVDGLRDEINQLRGII